MVVDSSEAKRWLKQYIADNGISLSELARRTGMAKSTLSVALSRKGDRGMITVARAYKALGISLYKRYVFTPPAQPLTLKKAPTKSRRTTK